ncbi:MAG: hypothetical protein Q4E03_02940 [Trueperella sp.]|nr:hypothetical protein [Trueperella sp.]
MRCYIPAARADLSAVELTARTVHAVTPALRGYYPKADLESLEHVATLMAADESLPRLAAGEARRIVCVAEVADADLVLPAAPARDAAEITGVTLTAAVPWHKVESILVDAPGSEELVRRAIAGEQQAFEQCGDIDLLWFDVTERALLVSELEN